MQSVTIIMSSLTAQRGRINHPCSIWRSSHINWGSESSSVTLGRAAFQHPRRGVRLPPPAACTRQECWKETRGFVLLIKHQQPDSLKLGSISEQRKRSHPSGFRPIHPAEGLCFCHWGDARLSRTIRTSCYIWISQCLPGRWVDTQREMFLTACC